MLLVYEDLVIGEALVNHSVSVDEALGICGINMEDICRENGWEDWDYEKLRVEM